MSVQAIPRNYSLSGGHQDAVELDDDRIVERMEETWWKPKLTRQQMRAIMQRRDGPALRHYGLWFFLLAVSAYLAVVSWGTWWAVPGLPHLRHNLLLLRRQLARMWPWHPLPHPLAQRSPLSRQLLHDLS